MSHKYASRKAIIKIVEIIRNNSFSSNNW